MRRSGPDLLRWISLGLLLTALALFFFELVSYSQQRARMPVGLRIGSVPVGGLTQTEALERLVQTYNRPVELYYSDQLILLQPSDVGFRLDSEAMLAAAELERTTEAFWPGFWDFLWNRPGEAGNIPVRSEHSASELESYLRDIAARYDEPPTPPQPVPGTTRFDPGSPGNVLDVSRAVQAIGEELNQPQARRVNLPVASSEPSRPSLFTLETLLKQILLVQEFNGLADAYVADLRTGEEMHVVVMEGEDLPGNPDVAITAGSTIKIGIALTYFRFFDLPLDADQTAWMEDMLRLSGNETADLLMDEIDRLRGPLMVSDTLHELGLDSTFLAGYFALGAELLQVYRTPANQRSDITTDPDPYNQTTPTEMGFLLTDLYRCVDGGGAILAIFPNEITSDECRYILDQLAQNKIAVLIEAGVPEGTRISHKHGWTDSPLEWLGDAGVIYSPGGDYVLAVYLWDDDPMIWDSASQLVADISRAVYNFFNPPSDSGGDQT